MEKCVYPVRHHQHLAEINYCNIGDMFLFSFFFYCSSLNYAIFPVTNVNVKPSRKTPVVRHRAFKCNSLEFIVCLLPTQDIRRFFQPTLAKPAASNSAIKTGERKKSLPSDEEVKKKSAKARDSSPALTICLFYSIYRCLSDVIVVDWFQVKQPKSNEKSKDGVKKRKKHAVIESGGNFLFQCFASHIVLYV